MPNIKLVNSDQSVNTNITSINQDIGTLLPRLIQEPVTGNNYRYDHTDDSFTYIYLQSAF